MNEINNQNQQYKQPGIGVCIGGFLAGSLTKGLIEASHQLVAPKLMGKMKNLSIKLTQDELTTVENAIHRSINDSYLADKKVKIIKSTAKNASKIKDILDVEMNNNRIIKHFPEKLKSAIGIFFTDTVKDGQNAFYTFHSNTIVMPEKALNLAVFHEAGHAANANLSTVGKALQKCKCFSILATPIALIGLCKTKKAPDEKTDGFFDTTTNSIKENAGKLTFAAFLPTLIEEGMASIKGNNIAKKLLNPELAKKVTKSNALGFATYMSSASLSSIGIALGIKVKDAIAHPELKMTPKE